MNRFLRSSLFAIFSGILILSVSARSFAATYLLAEPLEQTVALDTPIRKTLFGATVAADLAWSSANTLIYYQITGEPFSTAAYGVYNLVSGMAFINAEVRLQEEMLARISRRKEIKVIAQNPGAENVRVLTTGYFEQTSPYSTKLQARSFIFLDTSSEPENGNWIKIPDEKKAKVIFQLEIPGGAVEPLKWESSLKELFEGTSVPADVSRDWNERLSIHSHQRSLWQKWVTKKGMEGVQISAHLINKGETIPLGSVATDSGVFRFLNGNKIQAWNNYFRRLFQLEKKPVPVKTQNTRVVRSKGCSSWFARLLGRDVVAPEKY